MRLPKTVYVFRYDAEEPDSLTVTDEQDLAFPLNHDGPVTVGVYDLRETVTQQKKTIVLRSRPARKGGR